MASSAWPFLLSVLARRYKVGTYKGVGHCNTYEQAMRECLKKRGLYPV